MWCIIYTVCSAPLLLSLMWASFKAKKAGALDSYSTPYQVHGAKNLLAALFWQLDVPGIILLIAVFGCILTVRNFLQRTANRLIVIAFHNRRRRSVTVAHS
jgi:SIT family siderophore-iron:H+ symporter-like MFS transporter